jgi:hypothetical protein
MIEDFLELNRSLIGFLRRQMGFSAHIDGAPMFYRAPCLWGFSREWV